MTYRPRRAAPEPTGAAVQPWALALVGSLAGIAGFLLALIVR